MHQATRACLRGQFGRMARRSGDLRARERDVNAGRQTVHTIASIAGPGDVGLFHNKTPAQRFDAFTATGSDGIALFADAFEGEESARRWRIRGLGAANPDSYPIYQREHLLAPIAPMIETTRYVSPVRIGW